MSLNEAQTAFSPPPPFTVVIPERRAEYEIDRTGTIRSYFDGTQRFAVGAFVRSKHITAIPDETPGMIVHIRVKDEDREVICGALMTIPMNHQKNIRLAELLKTLFAPPGAKHIIVHFRGEDYECSAETSDLELIPPAATFTTA